MAGFALLLLPTAATAICHYPWAEYNGTCYKAFQELKTFDNALAACQAEGGTLASLSDEDTHNWVVDLMTNNNRK